MASWLVGTLHVSAATARAWVRVGRALEALPYLRAAFAAGELSWDQISAATQFANLSGAPVISAADFIVVA